MSPPCVKAAGSTRVAVVGAPTDAGTLLREAMAEVGVSGSRVDLYASTHGEVVLSEYDGEARMIQEPDLDAISRHDLIFICEAGPSVAEVCGAVSSRAVIIDLLDCLPQGTPSRRVHPAINPPAEPAEEGGYYVVPHPIGLALGELLHPLQRELGVAQAAAVVVRPAADFGPEGIEELRQQTVQLLRFAELPVERFGGQLAFNVIPQSRLSSEPPGLEARIERELEDVMAWPERRVGVRLLTAPLFHGHAVQLHFRLEQDASVEQLRFILDKAGFLGAGETDGPATPLELVGEPKTRVSDLTPDGLGGFWLWVVAGEIGARGAEHALRLAEQLGKL